MKSSSNHLWKQRLSDQTAENLVREIDIYDNEVTLRQQGKIEEKVFAETRLRRGAYGQRYDNGQRHDGHESKRLDFADRPTKGPNTLWDAPGMQRIKIPFGGLDVRQLEVLAELAEEYSDSIVHITTRQDVQLHYIHIEDTPAIMRRLAAAGITTREACGNSVRNVTACPIAGVCRTQTFDVTPYSKALAFFLLGHPDCQGFGRKFKISFSGCRDEACALARLHDIGAVAATREVDGRTERGFEFWVGGGLGAVPHQAKLFSDFIPEAELLPISQSICRVFARLGEKKNRNTARLKFVVGKLGIDEFRRLVYEDRATLAHDARWTEYLAEVHDYKEEPLKQPAFLQITNARPAGFDHWYDTNVYGQRQAGYATVTVALPLGDITSDQVRALADIARKYVKDTIRTTVEQNIVLRWVSEADLPALYQELMTAGLGTAGAGSIVDITTCPGTDTCKLGISSSRGLAGELRLRLGEKSMELDAAIRGLRIKISGCFNSCGQHHVADLGFYGVNRNKNGYAVPHFQVVLGGQWTENAASYGLAIGAVPSKRIPETVERITSRYVAERQPSESFQAFIKRIGKAECKKMLDEFSSVPAHDVDASMYVDWADAREYSLGDIGVGECAGEVVSATEFELAACEREVFEAQLLLEKGDIEQAVTACRETMLHGARALLDFKRAGGTSDPDKIVQRFRELYYDTQVFFDPFVGGNFAGYFFKAQEDAGRDYTPEQAHQLVEETQLFIEACLACHSRMIAAPAPAHV